MMAYGEKILNRRRDFEFPSRDIEYISLVDENSLSTISSQEIRKKPSGSFHTCEAKTPAPVHVARCD